jgi:penicillin-binding protein 2
MSKFGFGRPTGIDIGGELGGLFPSREWKNRVHHQPWFPGETVITGIGQGFTLTTPLQLASATAVLATHGEHFRPRVVRALSEGNPGKSVLQDNARLRSVVISNPANWDIIIDSMVRVLHGKRGTARASGRNASYRIAGKTGTAQVFGIAQDEEYEAEELARKLHDHSLFIAFAPADDPQIAVAVIAENAGSGSAVAAPIARKVLDYYLLGVAS